MEFKLLEFLLDFALKIVGWARIVQRVLHVGLCAVLAKLQQAKIENVKIS